MSKAQAITEKVMKMFKGMKTEKLLELWETTTESTDENVSIVRGWLMDEIERRNPEAFEEWLDKGNEKI